MISNLYLMDHGRDQHWKGTQTAEQPGRKSLAGPLGMVPITGNSAICTYENDQIGLDWGKNSRLPAPTVGF